MCSLYNFSKSVEAGHTCNIAPDTVFNCILHTSFFYSEINFQNQDIITRKLIVKTDHTETNVVPNKNVHYTGTWPLMDFFLYNLYIFD